MTLCIICDAYQCAEADAHVISYSDVADTCEYFGSDGELSVARQSAKALGPKQKRIESEEWGRILKINYWHLALVNIS